MIFFHRKQKVEEVTSTPKRAVSVPTTPEFQGPKIGLYI